MKKIWAYIAMFFVGVSAGIAIAVKYLVPEKTVVNVKKQRIWGRNNEMNAEVNVDAKTLESDKKQAKLARKQDKIIKRNRKKADKSAKRLENGTT